MRFCQMFDRIEDGTPDKSENNTSDKLENDTVGSTEIMYPTSKRKCIGSAGDNTYDQPEIIRMTCQKQVQQDTRSFCLYDAR